MHFQCHQQASSCRRSAWGVVSFCTSCWLLAVVVSGAQHSAVLASFALQLALASMAMILGALIPFYDHHAGTPSHTQHPLTCG